MTTKKGKASGGAQIIESTDSSLLDVVDNVLNKGVLLRGEAVLSIAGVDLIYLKLSVVLCAADRIIPRKG